jgi:excisionase family DNA binding protein
MSSKQERAKRKPAPVTSGEFLTVAQVASELHLSVKSIQRRISRGEFCPFLRIGRKMLWSRSRLDQWFAEHESPTGIPAQRRSRRRAA